MSYHIVYIAIFSFPRRYPAQSPDQYIIIIQEIYYMIISPFKCPIIIPRIPGTEL